MSHLETTVCNLCHSDRWNHLYRKFELDIVKCQDCGLVYAGPSRLTRETSWLRYNPDYFWKEYLPSQGVIEGKFDQPAFDERYAPILGLIQGYRKSGTLLEIGCGAGFFLKAAERKGWQSFGLEVSIAAVNFARDLLGLEVFCSTLDATNFADASFDVIAMFDTIEHLLDPMAELRIVHRLLRPGGGLIITTPNINALSRFALGQCWAVLSPFEHMYYFSIKTLTRMLHQSGFENVPFGRYHGEQGLYQTMNPQHNQAPDSWRAKLYTRFVNTYGHHAMRFVKSLGLADNLYVIVEKKLVSV